MVQVRYIVDDVQASVDFYVSMLGFEVDQNFAPAMAILKRGDLTLWVAGPQASATKPMPDGTQPIPGGWNRFVLVFDDLEAHAAKIRAEGVTFKNEILSGPGGKQILCVDPSGNVIELFQPA